jgi:hypothetical protein
MANPTSNFNWQMPTPTDLVTDLPADFEVFGQAVDSSMADLLGGTTGQILAKNSNTNMDFVWIANDQGDITGITASSPLTGGGTSGAITVGIQDALTTQKGAVQLSDSTSTTSSILAATPTAVKAAYDLADGAIPKSLIDAAGDLIVGTADNTAGRLGIGTAGQVLKVNSGATALEWGTSASGATFSGCRVTKSSAQSTSNSADSVLTFDTETFDVDGYHDNSTNNSRITIPSGKTGYFLINGQVSWAANASGVRLMDIYKNGATRLARNEDGNNGGSYNKVSQASTIVYLTAGDYVELRAFQESGGNLNVNSGDSQTYFAISYLGA